MKPALLTGGKCAGYPHLYYLDGEVTYFNHAPRLSGEDSPGRSLYAIDVKPIRTAMCDAMASGQAAHGGECAGGEASPVSGRVSPFPYPIVDVDNAPTGTRPIN